MRATHSLGEDPTGAGVGNSRLSASDESASSLASLLFSRWARAFMCSRVDLLATYIKPSLWYFTALTTDDHQRGSFFFEEKRRKGDFNIRTKLLYRVISAQSLA